MKLEELNQMNGGGCISVLGAIFEHSPWVAESIVDARPFSSVETLHHTMCKAVAAADRNKQMALIRAHPDLAGKAALAGKLTDESTKEQAGAGLDQMSSLKLSTSSTTPTRKNSDSRLLSQSRAMTSHRFLQRFVSGLKTMLMQKGPRPCGRFTGLACSGWRRCLGSDTVGFIAVPHLPDVPPLRRVTACKMTIIIHLPLVGRSKAMQSASGGGSAPNN